jgi:hypothetical protein
MKIVINGCYGGFSLSDKALKRLCEIKGIPCHFFKMVQRKGEYKFEPIQEGEVWMSHAFSVSNPNDLSIKDRNNTYISSRPEDRADLDLIRVVEEMGKDADGECAKLKIVEIPDGIDWEISEYDGMESVEERHRSWY